MIFFSQLCFLLTYQYILEVTLKYYTRDLLTPLFSYAALHYVYLPQFNHQFHIYQHLGDVQSFAVTISVSK